MVIYTCCDGNPEWFRKLSSDDGWPVMAEIVRTTSSGELVSCMLSCHLGL